MSLEMLKASKSAKYRCLECGNEGHWSKMLVTRVLGDKVKVRAPVCRFCNE